MTDPRADRSDEAYEHRSWWPTERDLAATVGLAEPDRPDARCRPGTGEDDSLTVIAARLSTLCR